MVRWGGDEVGERTKQRFSSLPPPSPLTPPPSSLIPHPTPMFSKLKHIKQLKKQGKEMQNELSTIVNEGSAAWGKVKVIVNGNRELVSVTIDPSMLTDARKLEEAVKDAFKDATGFKYQMKLSKKMQEMGGLDMLKNLGS